ncbi:MAG: TolC family protein [Phycisphaerae bacterium]|nr:TolC family protein [Phycisphaerae bacterium]
MYTKWPTSTDPAAAALRYHPADEKIDVANRLRIYAGQAGLNLENSPDAAKRLLEPAPGVLPLDLNGVFRESQKTGREFLNAEESYLLSAIRVLQERHLWGPQLFNDTNFVLAGEGENGNFEHALDVINRLRIAQRLPYGGSVEAAWIVAATQQLRNTATDRYRQSSTIVLSGNVPLLRGAGMVAQENLIQTERDLVYAARDFERFRREYLVSLASDYFNLLLSRDAIVNQLRSISSLENLERATAAKVEAGRVEAFEKGIASNRVQSARSGLVSLVNQYIARAQRLQIRLGRSIDQPIGLVDDVLRLPDPQPDEVTGAQLALEYRLELQNLRDRLDDSRRAVANARNELLPDLNVGGTITIPTDPDNSNGGLAIDPGELNYAATANLSLPLNREVERLNLRARMIELNRQVRNYEEARENVIAEVRDAIRSVLSARLQLQLAESQVEINRLRLRGQQLQIDTVDTQSLVDSENALLESENERDRALTDLRNAVLDFLLATGQLRVAYDGTFLPLPGMEIAPAEAP